MKTMKITVESNKDAQWLMDLFGKLNFVTSVESVEDSMPPEIPKGKFSSDEAFLSMCGLWKNREISVEKMREQAWRKIKL